MITEASFEIIYPYWQKYLWPGRESPIEPTSAINHLGEIDCLLMEQAVFFYVFKTQADGIVGVLSVQKTGEFEFRSRGLWVDPKYRKQGVGSQLVEQVCQKAQSLGAKKIWTMPREDSIGFYLKNGFSVYKETDAYEFGKHYLVSKEIVSY